MSTYQYERDRRGGYTIFRVMPPVPLGDLTGGPTYELVGYARTIKEVQSFYPGATPRK